MKNDEIDAVEMTRRIRDEMYEKTKDLGPDQLLRYFKERSASASRRVQQREAESQVKLL